MSTILKALRRLEEDRSAQSSRPLREEVAGSGRSQRRRRRRGRPLLLVVLGLGVAGIAGGLAYWSATRSGDPAPEVAAANPAEPARPSQPRVPPQAQRPSQPGRVATAPRPAPEPEAGGLGAGALASSVEVVKRAAPGPRIAEDEVDETGTAAERRVLPTTRKLAASELPGRHRHETVPVLQPRTYEVGSPAAEPVEADEPSPTSAAPRRDAPPEPLVASAPARAEAAPRPTPSPAPDEISEAPAPPEPAPRTREAEPSTPVVASASAPSPARSEPKPRPASRPVAEPAPAAAPKSPTTSARETVTRVEVPDLVVERTIWHPDAERRVAVIELGDGEVPREVHEGDAVGPLVVSKIEPSGVVFLHDGIELRRRVGGERLP